MFAEVVSVSAPTSVSAAGGPDCHLMSGCGFPAPGAEIFVFEDIFNGIDSKHFFDHFIVVAIADIVSNKAAQGITRPNVEPT